MIYPIVLLICGTSFVRGMDILFEWKKLPIKTEETDYWNSRVPPKEYSASSVFPLDADFTTLDPKSRIFLTVPRFFPGVPVTLTTVTPHLGRPVLEPYPDWDTNTKTDCSGLTSVIRIRTDECGRLWVLDAGVVENMTNNSRRACQPKLLAYDLKTDNVVFKYPIPDKQLVKNSLLGNMVVDITNNECNKPFIYIADIVGYGLIVVDGNKKISWRFSGDYFKDSPGASHFNVNGVEFDLPDGVISLTLSPEQSKLGDKYLYFHSFASFTERTVNTSSLKYAKSLLSVESAPVQYLGQSGPTAMSGPVFFYTDLPDNSLYCWNYQLPYKTSNIAKVYKNDKLFQFPTGLKVFSYNNQDYVLAVTNRLQKLIDGSISENDINFRILRTDVQSLISNTKCA